MQFLKILSVEPPGDGFVDMSARRVIPEYHIPHRVVENINASWANVDANQCAGQGNDEVNVQRISLPTGIPSDYVISTLKYFIE